MEAAAASSSIIIHHRGRRATRTVPIRDMGISIRSGNRLILPSYYHTPSLSFEVNPAEGGKVKGYHRRFLPIELRYFNYSIKF